VFAVMRWGGALLLVAVLAVAAVAKVSPDPGFFCSMARPVPSRVVWPDGELHCCSRDLGACA
jgi:hypothetical protein